MPDDTTDYDAIFMADRGSELVRMLPPEPPTRSSEAGERVTTAQWIGEFNAELSAAGVPEDIREYALQQAIHRYFERRHVVLGKAAS